MKSFKMLWDNYGPVGSILILLFALYVIYLIYSYVSNKSSYGSEQMSSDMNRAYANKKSSSSSVPVPANPTGQNEVFSSVSGVQSSLVQPGAGGCSSPNMTNPSDLLPISSPNSQWAELNPSGKGELSNINFLKAGYHIGIDTIGQSLRNANLQLRSETPNPQLNVGPWNQSTITPDFIRPPLEIGDGPQ